jgi:hypothetical protein
MVTRNGHSPTQNLRREEHIMKKLVLTATVGLAAATLTGATVIPAAGDADVFTKRFVSHDIASHSLGAQTFAGAAVDRRDGQIIGYDSFTGHFYPDEGRADIWVAYALKNGTIAGVVHANNTGAVFPGRILNGTGKYKGIRGTIAARPAPQNGEKTFVTLTYHF